jgi:two-component system chemotaxis response regulator CheB
VTLSPPITRVLVLDSAAPRRARLKLLLETDASFQLVGAAADAEHALALAQRMQPDVVLIGHGPAASHAVAWTRRIMQTRPLPVVALADAGADGDTLQAFELMQAGAVAVVPEPAGLFDSASEPALPGLLQKLRLMSEVKVVRRWARSGEAAPHAPALSPAARQHRIQLVAIGASTGGPIALQQVLTALPAAFAAPILIVQHISGGFLQGLAEWLTSCCPIPVEVASAATKPRAGRAYLAPDDMHMRIGPGGSLVFDRSAPVHGHRPAVSCLFDSAARHCGRDLIAILLTGMGKDGAAELKRLKDAGAITIAQDQASSAVHGMPGEAIRIGAARYVMSPREIGEALPTFIMD